MLLPADGHIGSQHFIDAVDGGTTIDVARHLGDDLGGHGRGGADGFRGIDLRIAHLEAVGQHPFQIDQHAVEHREERRVVEIVEVQITALMSLNHITGQHVAGGIVLGDDTGQQVALGRDHLGVFVGILVEQGGIGLLNQTADLLRQTAARLASLISVVTIFDIGTGDGLVVGSHQVVFDPVLDLVDINFTTPFQLLTHCA